jgi:hypothetical protein
MGHGTGTGGYVQGRDYINPAIRPLFLVDLQNKFGEGRKMPSVDNRVVQMEFNSQSFEQESLVLQLPALPSLKDSLNFGRLFPRTLRDLQSQGSKFNLDGIGAAVEGISSKFDALSARLPLL